MSERNKRLLKITPLRVVYGTILALWRRLPKIALYMAAFFAIFYVGQQIYYRVAPADSFLNYYYAKVDDTPIGTEPLMTLCRTVNYENLKIEAFRTFIYYDEAGRSSQVAEYNFEANVEKGDGNCTNIRLKKQPQRAGTYRAHTEYVFYVAGAKKSGQYDTNQYKMTETNVSLEDQIRTLQDQINILRSQLEARGVQIQTQPTQQSQSPQASASAGTTPAQNGTTPTPGGTGNAGTGTNPVNSGTNTPPPEPPQQCTVTLLGLGLICL